MVVNESDNCSIEIGVRDMTLRVPKDVVDLMAIEEGSIILFEHVPGRYCARVCK